MDSDPTKHVFDSIYVVRDTVPHRNFAGNAENSLMSGAYWILFYYIGRMLPCLKERLLKVVSCALCF
jgi:hypothetical protein